MTEDLQEVIGRIKPLADEVVEAASALNAAIQAAAGQGLSVRLDVLQQPAEEDGESIPLVRARISKRIAGGPPTPHPTPAEGRRSGGEGRRPMADS